MKKNGFTLLEILISISLVSIVLITMLNNLIQLKEIYLVADKDTDIRVNGAVISRTINKDIIENDGINSSGYKCQNGETNENEKIISQLSTCTFTLRSGENRKLSIYLVYEKEEIPENKNRTLRKNRSTIEYKDTDRNKVLLIKTIDSTEVYEGETLYPGLSDKFHFKRFKTYGIVMDDGTRNGIISYDKDNIIKLTIEASNPEFNINIYSGWTNS